MPCHLSWSPVGQAMTSANKTDLWVKDTLDVFQQLDNLFGKNYKSFTLPFTMFGIFDGKSNVLFHDSTVRIRNVPTSRNMDQMPIYYNNILDEIKTCHIKSASNSIRTSSIILFVNALCLYLLK